MTLDVTKHVMHVEFWNKSELQFVYQDVINIRYPSIDLEGQTDDVIHITMYRDGRKTYATVHNPSQYEVIVIPTQEYVTNPVSPWHTVYYVRTRYISAAGSVNERSLLVNAIDAVAIEQLIHDSLPGETVVYARKVDWRKQGDWATLAIDHLVQSPRLTP